MSEILKFNGLNYGKESPESVLEKAKNWKMDRCVIIGFTEDNNMVFGGSYSEAGGILLLLELAKKFIVDNDFAREP